MPFAGVSLIARTVRTALDSGCFIRVIVSTDDEQIAEEARCAGALVPFIRPARLADDTASSVDVIRHAVEFMQPLYPSDKPDAVCLLQVTSPMLTCQHLCEAVELFWKSGFNSLSSMVRVDQYPEWMFGVAPDTRQATPESPAGITMAGSAIRPRFIENGSIYLVKEDWLMATGTLYDFAHHGCYTMSPEESVDIDTRADWDYAEFLFKRRQNAG